MNDRQRRRYERLVRSRDYFSIDGGIFPEGSKGAQALARFRAAIEDVEQLDASRETGGRAVKQGTETRSDARERVRRMVSAMARTSQTIAMDDASFKGRFVASTGKVSDETLLAVARSFAAEALPVKAKFIEYDMPADFLENLNAAIEDFEAAVNQQNQGMTARKSATGSMDDALTRAEQELERCDTALRNKVTDAAKLAAWDSARRMERAPQKRKAKQPDKTSSATPAQK